MPFNTRNPIPSGDLRDLDDNARNIDTWANDKTKLSHPDRFGVERRTWHGIEQEAKLNIQQAIDAKNAAQEAAMMSGFSKYADTLAQLEAGIGTDYVDGDVVIVFQDESRGDTSSIFKIESGAAEFKLTFDKTRQDLLSFTGTISADAEWSDVPAHSDPAFDTQAQALANRTEFIAQELTQPSGDDALGGFDTYAKLRAYSGPATRVKVGVLGTTNMGTWGEFVCDASDTTTPDDGALCVVSADGRRFKRNGVHEELHATWGGIVPNSGEIYTTRLRELLALAKARQMTLVLPPGEIYIDDTINLIGAANYGTFGAVIKGSGVRASTVRKVSVSTYRPELNAVFLVEPVSGDDSYNIHFTNIVVQDATANSRGFVTDAGISGFKVEDCAFYCTGIDINIRKNAWINSFRNLHLSGQGAGVGMAEGFIMEASGTTNRFDNLYSYGSKGRGFVLSGEYSSVGSLACDDAKGVAYTFNYFIGSVGSLGYENPSHSTTPGFLITFINSHVEVGEVSCHRLKIASGFALFRCQGSNVDIGKLFVFSKLDANGALHSLYKSHLRIGSSFYEGAGITFADDATADIDSYIQYGGIDGETRHLFNGDIILGSSIGLDRSKSQSKKIKAIHLNAHGSHRYGGDGTTDLRWGRCNVGDIFFENDPSKFNVAGYIISKQTGGSSINASESLAIAVVNGGATAQRPVDAKQFTQYFDTTLGKPVWKYGANWVDASGVVS